MSANICKTSTQKAELWSLAACHLITNAAFLFQHCSNSGLLARVLPSLWPGCVVSGLHCRHSHWWSISLKVVWRTACLHLGDCQLCKRCVWVSSGIVACILGTDFRRMGSWEGILLSGQVVLKATWKGCKRREVQETKVFMLLSCKAPA